MSQSNLPPPAHPEAQHFVLHERQKEGHKSSEQAPGDDVDASEAAIDYLQAMAGFMGVVEAPKELDPEVQAEAAVAFLQTLWYDAESQDAGEVPTHVRAHAADTAVTSYERIAKCLADKTFASARNPASSEEHCAFDVAAESEQLAQRALRDAHQEAETAAAELSALRKHLGSLKNELNEVTASTRPKPSRSEQLERCVNEQEALLLPQQAIVDRTERSLDIARAAASAAALDLRQGATDRDEKRATVEAVAQAQSQRAVAVQTKELRAAEGYQQRKQKKQSQAAEIAKAHAAATAERLRTEQESSRRALLRLRESQAQLESAGSDLSLLADERKVKRADALLHLKASVDAVHEDMRVKVETYRARLQIRKAEHRREFDSLLQSGLNPYEMERRKSRAIAVRAQQRRLAAQLRRGRNAIMAQLVMEESRHQAALQATARQKFLQGRLVARAQREQAYDEKYQQEMGSEASHAKVERYMCATTATKTDILDPTSRERIVPSAVTNTKQASFGLGGAPDAVRHKVKAKHADEHTALISALLPRGVQQLIEQNAGRRSAAGGDEGAAEDDVAQVHAVAECPGTWEEAPRAAEQGAAGKLSRFERRAMDKAALRLKEGIVQPQTFAGKIFQGPAFAATPPNPCFSDFEAGETYRQRVTLTNVSFGRCTLRVQGFPEEHTHLFSVQHEPPGPLSPGMTCDLWVTFSPQDNEDRHTELQLLASTGPVTVPVICTAKRARVSASQRVVDFGPPVMLGDAASRTLELRNDGALAASYAISACTPGEGEHGTDALATKKAGASDRPTAAAPHAAQEAEQGQLVVGPFLLAPFKGVLAGHSSASVQIVFDPRDTGQAEADIRIAFLPLQPGATSVAPLSVHIQGTARDMALTAAASVLDFGCCFHGTAYREDLVLRNNSSATVKASVAVPHVAAHMLTVSPKFAFVQAHSELAFSVALCGSEDSSQRAKRYVTDADAQVLRIPLKITSPGQRLAPEVAVAVQLTAPQLTFEPTALDLGRCVLHESKCAPLRVRNHAAVAQSFAFCELPHGVDVQPLDGLGSIQPHGAADLDISYTPSLVGQQCLQLSCKTLALGAFHVQCTADAVALPLRLEHNYFDLAATACGDCTVVSTALVNSSKQPQGFQFVPPAQSGVSVTPTSGQLAAGQRMRVQIEFAPAAPQPSHSAAGTEVEHDAEPSREPEGDANAAPAAADHRDAQLGTVHVPCFIQGCTDENGKQGGLRLSLRTCTAQPLAELLDVPFDCERRCYVYDFGTQPLGSRCAAVISVRNLGQQDVQLSVDALDPLGPFEQSAAVRSMPAGGIGRVRLQFQPRQEGSCLEVIRLRAHHQTILLQLTATGLAPRVVLQDAGEPASLDFGHVAVGDEERRRITLHNPCPFDLRCDCRFAGLCPCNAGNLPPFFASPEALTIPAGGTEAVAISFQPDFQAPCFEDIMNVILQHQQAPCSLRVTGHGWAEGCYITGACHVQHAKGVLDVHVARADPLERDCSVRHMRAAFAEPVRLGETRSHMLEVCSLKSAAGVGTAVELSLEPLSEAEVASGWKVDAHRVSANAGDRKALQISYTAPSTPPAASAAALGAQEYAVLVLHATGTGGLPALPQGGRKYRIEVKALVLPKRGADAAAATSGKRGGKK